MITSCTVTLIYCDEDQQKAEIVADALGKDGVEVVFAAVSRLMDDTLPIIHLGSTPNGCTLVLWSRSVGNSPGKFLRHKALHALKDGCLLQCRIQKSQTPDEFRHLPLIDLAGWRGSVQNINYQELLTAIKARCAGVGDPTIKGRLRRFRRRTAASIGAVSIISTIAFIGSDLFSIQENICSVSWVQPEVSDTCGAFGLGGKPSKEERLAWAAIPDRDCQALKNHVDQFPTGVFGSQAADLYTLREVDEVVSWSEPFVTKVDLYTPVGETFLNKTIAQEDALTRAKPLSERVCRLYASSTLYKYKRADFSIDIWQCRGREKETSCSFSGFALCELQVKQISTKEICPSKNALIRTNDVAQE